MQFDDIFNAYYTLYRGTAAIPASTDDEYTIALRMANEAVSRWANYDGTYWNELFDTLQASGDGDSIVVAGTTQYDAPADMKEAGGFIKIKDSNGNTVRNYAILEPQDAQFQGDVNEYAYFTGNVSDGFVLNLNPAPDSSVDGMSLDYVYYRQPTLFTTGTDTTEMRNPYFIVHRILAQRFRTSRNPYYTSALRDAEDTLKIMQMENNSGNWADPWRLADNSGATWGRSSGFTGRM